MVDVGVPTMHTFRALDQQIGLVPAAAARTLGAIDTARGREDAFRLQRSQVLDALIVVARIQSTEASNAIEDVVAPRKRIEALVEQKTTPRNRSEAEIAGYRAVLDLIHEQAGEIPFRPSVVEQLHRDLYQYTAVPVGRSFRDGNGRMARLLTLLLLYQSGYSVGRYISLERLINHAR